MRLTTRRAVAGILLAALAGCGTGPGSPPDRPPSRAGRIDASLSRAAAYLTDRQQRDGAWRSDLYGPLKDGPSLTPLVLRALQGAPPTPAGDAALDRGASYLAAMARPDGTIDAGDLGLAQPVYTSALSVMVLSRPGREAQAAARDAWLAYLRQRQLTEALGWQPADRPYGGWGYCVRLPRKPPPGEGGPPLLESNLSATAFALEALRAAGVPADDPAWPAALTFLRRCQNYAEAPRRKADLDDGGFFFIYDDPVRNKAGGAGQDRDGRERFASYGSATADGLGALLACGLRTDDERPAAALRWLGQHFDAARHPGRYATNREGERGSVYHYYCWSLARALSAAHVEELATPAGTVRWAEALADELLKRQRDDGSWANDALAQRENDPLVATSEAAAALALCRQVFREEAMRRGE
jgi:squalene-hopene/tetraprenyl-beta-curcumene cyclase